MRTKIARSYSLLFANDQISSDKDLTVQTKLKLQLQVLSSELYFTLLSTLLINAPFVDNGLVFTPVGGAPLVIVFAGFKEQNTRRYKSFISGVSQVNCSDARPGKTTRRFSVTQGKKNFLHFIFFLNRLILR